METKGYQLEERVQEEVNGIIAKVLDCPVENIRPDTRWKDLKADWLDIGEIIVEIEKRLHIIIEKYDDLPVEDFDTSSTVKELFQDVAEVLAK